MAGITTSFKTDKILLGAGKLYGLLSTPGASARMTLDATTKTPDSTANPTGIHLGATTEGCVVSVKTTWEEYFVDEFPAPVQTAVTAVEASIAGSFVPVTDMTLMELLTPGMGTKATGSGYEELSLGQRAIVYQSVAVVAPLIEDVTKVMVFQLYKALNTTGFEIPIGRKKMAATPFNFKGYEVTSRAAGDSLGKFWKEIA